MKHTIIQEIREIELKRIDLADQYPTWFSPSFAGDAQPQHLYIDTDGKDRSTANILVAQTLQAVHIPNKIFCFDVYNQQNSKLFRVVGIKESRTKMLSLVMSANYFDRVTGVFIKPYANTKNLTLRVMAISDSEEWLVSASRRFDLEPQIQQMLLDVQGWQISSKKPLKLKTNSL